MAERAQPGGWLLLAASPVPLFGLAYLSSIAIHEVLEIGPFDRAWVDWMITVPLMLLAPGMAALAVRNAPQRDLGRLVIGSSAGFVCVFATLRLVATTEHIGCSEVTSIWQVLPPSIAVGLFGALGFALAVTIAARVRPRASEPMATVVTLSLGAAAGFVAGAITLFAMSAAFPAALCAPRPL